jgi:hypothetical protein
MENQELVSSSRQCSITSVGFGQGFHSKEKCDNTGLSHYSPDMAAADFYLFTAWKERRFLMLLTPLRMRWKS